MKLFTPVLHILGPDPVEAALDEAAQRQVGQLGGWNHLQGVM